MTKYQKYDYAEIDFWVQARSNEKIRQSFIASYNNWRDEVRTILETYATNLSKEKQKYLPYMVVSLLEGATIQYLIEEGSFDLDQYFAFCKQMILQCIQDEKDVNV